jgi:hypothetical protein
MKIFEAIDLCDRQKPNAYSREDKIHWLSKLDGMIYENIISRHEGGPEKFDGYGPETDDGEELLAEDMYADMYVKWLFAQIDFANAEMDRYNNSVAMFNALYGEYKRAYTRKHMPKQPAYIKGTRGRRNGTADPF